MSWSYIQQQIQNATKQQFEITDITRSGVTFRFLGLSTHIFRSEYRELRNSKGKLGWAGGGLP